MAGVSTIAGPVLGGWLVTDFSWRWIFFVNVPIGAVALVMAGILMPNIQLNRRHKLDVGGVALSTAGLFLLCYGLIEGPSYSWGKVWGPISIPLILVVGAALLGLFMWLQWAERAGEPLVPFSIFADRNYSIMNFVVAAISFGMLGLFLPLTIFLQSVLGLSALQAGLVTAPMSLISMVVAPIAGRASDRLGGKWVVFAGVSLFAAGMGIVVASVHLGMSRWHFLPGLIVAGFGLGMTFAPLQTVAMRNIQPRMAGAASGFINTTRQLGGVIGSAAVGALLQSQLKIALADSAQKNVATMPANVPQQIKDGLVSAFSHVSGDLEIGAGKTGIDPKQIPEQFRAVVGATAKRIFDEGFTNAMRHTLWLPIAVMGLAAVSILFVRRDHGGPLTPAPAPAAEKTEVPAQQAR